MARRWLGACLVAVSVTLNACGGGNGGSAGTTAGAEECSLSSQQSWLQAYLSDWYYFYAQIPSVDPAAHTTIDSYFNALLVRTDANGQDLDRWSNVESSATFNQFFGEGKTLGYGLFVAGQTDDPLPLRVRYIAPGSAAEAGGLRRGMVIDAISGKDPAQLKAAADFGALTPKSAGDTLTLVVRDSPAAATARSVQLSASVYALQSVSGASVLRSPAGRRVGYFAYKDFVSSSAPALTSTLQGFASTGIDDLVLDLRYNGGGLISIARDLASAIGGSTLTGQRFVTLRYNDKHKAADQGFAFDSAALPALGLKRVYVLTGVRTCSASELVINGLAPFLEVIQIGGTTCGKPFGFNPTASCNKTFSAVNFESFNARDEGRYYQGLSARCAAADDFEHALGDSAETLTASALAHADTGACPVTSTSTRAFSVRPTVGGAAAPRRIPDGDAPGRDGMHAN